jgi:predicted nucleotidyltransferase
MEQPTLSKQAVLERLRADAERIQACGVKRLELFGSFARGEGGPESDVDLLVEFQPGRKTYHNFFKLAERLEQILQRPVELLTRESLSPYIAPRILQEAEDLALRA